MTAVLIAVVAVLFLVSPLVTIWALNTLFPLYIPYTFWTWLAVAALPGGGFFTHAAKIFKRY